MRLANRALLAILLCAAATTAWAGVPEWVKLTSAQTLPTYKPETNAVLLLAEQTTTLERTGEVHTVYRRVYKLLRPNWRAELSRISVQFGDETRLTYLKGWAISSTGLEYEVKEKDAVKTGAADEYTDLMEKELEIPGLDVGGVIAYEYQQRGHPLLNEDSWILQTNIPLILSRYRLKMPDRWTFETFWNNHDKIEPRRNGNEYIWEVANVGAIETEDAMPAWTAIAPRMVIHFHSPNRAGRSDWAAIGSWYSTAVTGRNVATEEMKRTVQELTAQAKSTREKIEVVARWVQQNVRYVAVEMGIGRYQPHFAGDVFKNRYGDCKDKVTLLSAMLKEIGVDSDYLLINSVRGLVRPESPSAKSFDHVILAIHVPKGLDPRDLPATYEHPAIGTLLLFDPTSEATPFGLLPDSQQKTLALLVLNGTGELIETPLLSPVTNAFECDGKFKVLPNGTLTGDVKERASGTVGSRYRQALKTLDKSDRHSVVEWIVGSNIAGYEVTQTAFRALDDISKPFEVSFTLQASGYAKKTGALLLVRPRVVGTKNWTLLESDKSRHYPVVFPGTAQHVDHFEIELPAGYEVDELPDPVDLSYDFGEYHSKVQTADNTLKYTRQFTIKEVMVPIDRLQDLKKFYRQIATDEKRTAVLRPKETSGK